MQLQKRERLAAWLFIAPALCLIGFFVVWPLIRAVIWSFMDVDLLNPDRATWTGLDNYNQLLQSTRFRQAFFNTAVFALMIVPLQTLLAFMLALLVNRKETCWRILKTIFFVPVVVSMPVLAVLWSILYQPPQGDQMGLINELITMLGLTPQSWLLNPTTALPAIACMSIWQGVGFQMMVFLAALQNVSKEQLESAMMDGASGLQRVFYIIIPGIKNSIIFVVTVTTILSFRLFVQPYIMTRGGPDDRTLSVIQYIYETSFLGRNLGRACAGAMLFLIVVAIITLLQRVMTREVRA